MKIAPFTYEIITVPALPDAGSCQSDFETILLSEVQSDAQRADTLLHEALHAELNQGLGEQLKGYDEKLEETLCAFLAPRLIGLLRDNPALVEFIKEAK
jgi:hypothetical protein